MSTDAAEYLDTQTLAGSAGYFHSENAATAAESPETPLVAASRGDATASVENLQPDALENLTNPTLIHKLKAQGIAVPRPASKARLIAALRGE